VPHLNVTLVNTSKTFTYPVVKPGDGSEVGWRDPYIYLTAEQLTVEGKWVPVEKGGYARCGLFASGWEQDVVELKPGEKLVLDWWPVSNFVLQYPARVRLSAHYEYRASSGKRGEPRPVAERGKMGDTPLFAIKSEPVEFEVVRPLDLKIKVKRPLKVGVEQKITDVIEVTVTNTTDRPITVTSPTQTADARLSLRGGGDENTSTTPFLTEWSATYGTKVELKPGETAVLLGPGELSNGVNGTWKGFKPGKVQIWADYTTTTWKPGATITATAEVPIEK
jgi:hypothetical protein